MRYSWDFLRGRSQFCSRCCFSSQQELQRVRFKKTSVKLFILCNCFHPFNHSEIAQYSFLVYCFQESLWKGVERMWTLEAALRCCPGLKAPNPHCAWGFKKSPLWYPSIYQESIWKDSWDFHEKYAGVEANSVVAASSASNKNFNQLD